MKKILIMFIVILLTSCSSNTVQEKTIQEFYKEIAFNVIEESEQIKAVGDIIDFPEYQFQVVNFYHLEGEDYPENIYVAEILYKNITDEYVLIAPKLHSDIENDSIWDSTYYEYAPKGTADSVYLAPGGTAKRFYALALGKDNSRIITVKERDANDTLLKMEVDLTRKLSEFKPLAKDLEKTQLIVYPSNEQASDNNIELVIRNVENVVEAYDDETKTYTVVDLEYKNISTINDLPYNLMLRDENGMLKSCERTQEGEAYFGELFPGSVHRMKLKFENYSDFENMSLVVFSSSFIPEVNKCSFNIALGGKYNKEKLVSDYNLLENVEVLKIGEIANFGDFEMTMNELYDDKGSGFMKAAENHTYRIAQFTLKNVIEKAGINPFNFYIVNDQGQIFPMTKVYGFEDKYFTLDDCTMEVGSEITRYITADLILGDNYTVVYDGRSDGYPIFAFDFSHPTETKE